LSAERSSKLELLRSEAVEHRRRGGDAGRQIGRGAIPNLPDRPRAPLIIPSVRRSYPVGRLEFSRAYQGRVFEVSVTSDIAPPDGFVVCLDTTLNASTEDEFATSGLTIAPSGAGSPRRLRDSTGSARGGRATGAPLGSGMPFRSPG
jgi:hypothetical protein